MVRRFIKRGYLGLVLFFLYAPIIVLIMFSFNQSKSMAHWSGFSLDWYVKLFQDPAIMNSLYITIIIAVLSSLIATVIGTFAAIGIHSIRNPFKTAILNITYLPIMNADIVTGISLMLLFVFFHMHRGFSTLLIAHITFNIPYVIMSVLPKLKQMNPQMYEAALDLGATPTYAMRKVILPEIMPGVFTGAILAFTLSLDDFVVSFFTQEGVQNLSITIYSMAKRGINPKINALSALMFITVLVLLLIINKRSSKTNKKRT